MTNIINHLAVVFPGQGSQSVGMLSDIAAEYTEVKTVFKEASDTLGYDLWKITAEGPAALLDQTIHTQPALLAAAYAVWKIIRARKSISPAMLAGHSLGEYTALLCAEAITFQDAVKLVAARGEFMQSAVPAGSGAMAAIVGLEDAAVADLCRSIASNTGEVISPANFNSIGQVVVAGQKNAVETIISLAKESGAKLAVFIPVSVPSHCALMKPAADRLADLLQRIDLKKPMLPVVNNVDVSIYQTPEAIRDGLARQLFMPVRWVETIQYMQQAGVTQFIECGPGKVLSGLNKRIDKTLQLMTTHDKVSLETYLKFETAGSV